jgi:hypothetical protein
MITNSTNSDSNMDKTYQRGSQPMTYQSPISVSKMNSFQGGRGAGGMHERSFDLVRNTSFNEIDNIGNNSFLTPGS